jgi:hypothetical protein
MQFTSITLAVLANMALVSARKYILASTSPSSLTLQSHALCLSLLIIYTTNPKTDISFIDGRLVNPKALPHTVDPGQPDIRIASNGCGAGVNIAGGASKTFTAGSTGSVTWFVTNGDGAGPMSVKVDTSGKGTSFNVNAQVTKNIDGINGGVPNSFPRGEHTIEFKVPDAKCTGCVLQVRQAVSGKEGFGSCVVVDIV